MVVRSMSWEADDAVLWRPRDPVAELQSVTGWPDSSIIAPVSACHCVSYAERYRRDNPKLWMRLLLDSRGVNFTRAYNAIVAARRLLEVVIFQGPDQGCAR